MRLILNQRATLLVCSVLAATRRAVATSLRNSIALPLRNHPEGGWREWNQPRLARRISHCAREAHQGVDTWHKLQSPIHRANAATSTPLTSVRLRRRTNIFFFFFFFFF